VNRKMQRKAGGTRKGRHKLRPDRTRWGRSLLTMKMFGDATRSFVRNLACGVCGQDNLNLRRGRFPSGCNHSHQTCPANGVNLSPGQPFSKILSVRLPSAVRQWERTYAGRNIAAG